MLFVVQGIGSGSVSEFARQSGVDHKFERALHGTILIGGDLVDDASREVFDPP